MTNGPGTESRLTNISQYHVENYRFDLQDSGIPHPLTADHMRAECHEIHGARYPCGYLHGPSV